MKVPGISWARVSPFAIANSVGDGPSGSIALIDAYQSQIVTEAMLSAAYYGAYEMADWAKHNHGWTNRTGNAERGLHGFVEAWPLAVACGISHGPDIYYAPMLEADPRFSVIDKTQARFSSRLPEIMARELNLSARGQPSHFRIGGAEIK